MDDKNRIIGPEDYAEPRCLLCGEPYGAEPDIKPVPQQRIVEKVNEYMSRRDYGGVERHLKYWLEEAKLGHDLQGELTIRNEMIGHYRKVKDKPKAMENVKEALRLVDALDFEGTRSAATTYVNAATACNSFGENERAAELFGRAKEIYEASDNTAPELLGGLYNNMGLVCAALGEYKEAYELFEKALSQMENVLNGAWDQASTLLNIANAKEMELGAEAAEGEIMRLLDRAQELLLPNEAPMDGYYAYVCEACAPTFSYYGYFLAANELNRRAREIYERA